VDQQRHVVHRLLCLLLSSCSACFVGPSVITVWRVVVSVFRRVLMLNCGDTRLFLQI
jgi:hypothetical protein